MQDRVAPQTPIANLLLAGAWTFPGGGMSAAMLSGVEAARLALGLMENQAITTMFMPTEFEQGEEIMSETKPPTNCNGHIQQSLGSAPAFWSHDFIPRLTQHESLLQSRKM